MTYATLMVNLELGHANAGLLQVTRDLAERFSAHVIGIAACQPMQMGYADGYIPGEIYEQDNNQRKKEIEAAEGELMLRSAKDHPATRSIGKRLTTARER